MGTATLSSLQTDSALLVLVPKLSDDEWRTSSVAAGDPRRSDPTFPELLQFLILKAGVARRRPTTWA